MMLRYRLDSGPFTPANTQMQLLDPLSGAPANVSPTWEWECTFGQVCQSGTASLSGGASTASNHRNYTSPAGFIAGLTTGASASWQVLGAPSGDATVTVRYSNYIGSLGGPAPRTISLVVNGTATQVTLPATSSWDDWATVTEPVSLTSGTNTIALTCGSGDDCNVNVDDIAVTASGATAAPFLPADPLGGYIRSYDSANGTYSSSPACGSGQSGATCTASVPTMSQGLLDRSGWYLLDDTRSAVWTSGGWLASRPTGDVEDGYLFGYGQNYATALSDLAKLTGPAPMLPESLFGNWFSQYYAYTASDYENQLLPEFAVNGVTLDNLSVDTDWKSPNEWDGWEWNQALFPDPTAFLAWARSEDLNVTLNVHPSIATKDPSYAQAQDVAGNTLAGESGSDCGFNVASCAVWDWSQVPQAESYFAVSQPTQDDIPFTWLDWCCDNSQVSQAGVTPDSWINHLYAQQLVNTGQRGFILSRIGASLQQSQAGSYPGGPWADHRSAIAFTGDAWGTWNTLATEAALVPDEATIGEPYVSSDIGSYLGPPPTQSGADPPDLYDRWVQLGTFEPILRLHSNNENRLPWQYPQPVRSITESFLRLREALLPYTYTLAAEANQTGLPMARPLYLYDPDQPSVYKNPTEYLYGPDMLVAPVTTPGDVASTTVWFPPGRWVDFFTGATFTGPSAVNLAVPLDQMPVFVRQGGIVPEQPSTGGAGPLHALTTVAYPGSPGSFDIYGDAGTGLGGERHAIAAEAHVADGHARRGVAGVDVALGILGQSDRHQPPVELLAVAPAQHRHGRARGVRPRTAGVGEVGDRDRAHAVMIAHTIT